MANLAESSIWETGVYQIEENDPVHGGANGITNRPIKQLANRTVWLKNELASSVQAINANLASLSTNKADKTLNLVAGNGLTGGGTLQANRTLTLGTPSQITASTTNSVTATSHTHAIDKASTTVQGIVQLNDTLASTATDQALTANQGKVLNDKITATDAKADTKANQATAITAGNGLTGGGTLQANRTLTLGTPSQITASTTNSVTATSHTHAIDKASTTVAGVVQLVDNLTTDDATKALTAKQGKALKDELDTTVKLTGDQTITGRKTFGEITVSPASINNSLIMGVGPGDIYIKNTVANKYLQLKNDGTLAISHDKVWLYSDRSDAVNLDRTDKVATAKAVKSLNDTKLGKTENAISATKLQTARTISLTGAVTGSVSFDGSGNVSIGTTLPSIASNVVVMTGTIDHGGTIPLPNGFTESQCKWMVSMHEDNTGNATWDLWESARLRHYGFRCFCDGRIVTAQAYLTGHNSPPGWVNGRANYIIIGVK